MAGGAEIREHPVETASMRRLAVVSAVLTVLWSTGALAGPTLDRVNEKKEMVVATNVGWPPQGFLDENNELVGFDIDVANEIGKRLGIGVRFETPEWAVMTGGRWHGRFDLGVGSVAPTKARAQAIDFAAIYYYSPYVYVVHADSDIQTEKDLDGKVIGVETATASEDFINRRLEIDAPGLPPVEYNLEPGEVRTFPDSMLPFDDLRVGAGVRLDAVIAPEQTALNAARNGYPIRILKDIYPFRSPAVIIADKGDPEWTAKVGKVVEEMKADGTLGKLTIKWYDADYSKD
jgi:polar amino acid transport system substrate-binding protein